MVKVPCPLSGYMRLQFMSSWQVICGGFQEDTDRSSNPFVINMVSRKYILYLQIKHTTDEDKVAIGYQITGRQLISP